MANRNDLKLMLTDGNQVVLHGSVEFEVVEQGPPDLHIVDVINAVVLNKVRVEERARLTPGKYCISITAAFSDMSVEEE